MVPRTQGWSLREANPGRRGCAEVELQQWIGDNFWISPGTSLAWLLTPYLALDWAMTSALAPNDKPIWAQS